MMPGNIFASKNDFYIYSSSLHLINYSKYFYYGFLFQILGYVILSVEYKKNDQISPAGPALILTGTLLLLYAPGEIRRAGSELMKSVKYK